MSNNLRIIYQNAVDIVNSSGALTTTISGPATTAGLPYTNMQVDSKSLVWRTGTTKRVSFLVSFAASTIVGGVILPFCNLSPTATIKVTGYTSPPTIGGTLSTPTVTGGTPVSGMTVGPLTACPYQPLGMWNWGALPLGSNTYSYGGGTYGRIWLTDTTQLACTSLAIEIIDDNNTNNYLEFSRMVIGAYWQPVYTAAWGAATQSQDMSEHMRSEAGDLVTNRGIIYNTMKFDLDWISPADRLTLSGILRKNGIARPLYISLFPNDIDSAKEQAHQIYGKLSQLNAVTHPFFELYSTTIDIQEI